MLAGESGSGFERSNGSLTDIQEKVYGIIKNCATQTGKSRQSINCGHVSILPKAASFVRIYTSFYKTTN